MYGAPLVVNKDYALFDRFTNYFELPVGTAWDESDFTMKALCGEDW